MTAAHMIVTGQDDWDGQQSGVALLEAPGVDAPPSENPWGVPGPLAGYDDDIDEDESYFLEEDDDDDDDMYDDDDGDDFDDDDDEQVDVEIDDDDDDDL